MRPINASQETLFFSGPSANEMPAPMQSAAEPTALEAPAPHGLDWREADPYADRRAEVLGETMGWSPNRARLTAGLGDTAVEDTIVPMQRADWTPEGRDLHLRRAEETRQMLEALGLPRTRKR